MAWSFHSPNGIFPGAEVFNFNEVQLLSQDHFFLYRLWFWCFIYYVIIKSLFTWIFSYVIFRSFTVSHFTLRSVIHSELIFVKRVRSVSRSFFFFFFACLYLLVPAAFVVNYLFAVQVPLLCYQRLFFKDLFVGFLFFPIDLFVLLLIQHCIDYCRFIVSLEVR